jgi:hypothetical protein
MINQFLVEPKQCFFLRIKLINIVITYQKSKYFVCLGSIIWAF